MTGRIPRLTRRAALLLPLAATGCSFIDGLLGDAKTPLPGKREAVAATTRPGLAIDPANTARIVVPPPTATATWPQPGGGPSHVVGNVATRGFTPAWRASIGEGGGYREKITAQPIVIPGRVVTMDSDGKVACFDLGTGSRTWRTSTEADDSRSTNVGGGVSYADGTVFAATGRAELLALDAASGAIRWRKPLGSPARSAPTVADKRLVVLTLDDQVQSFDFAGQRQWGYQAATAATTLFGQAAPAFADGIVVAAFGSGELVALRAESGTLAWSDSLAASRGRNSIVDLSGIRALPSQVGRAPIVKLCVRDVDPYAGCLGQRTCVGLLHPGCWFAVGRQVWSTGRLAQACHHQVGDQRMRRREVALAESRLADEQGELRCQIRVGLGGRPDDEHQVGEVDPLDQALPGPLLEGAHVRAQARQHAVRQGLCIARRAGHHFAREHRRSARALLRVAQLGADVAADRGLGVGSLG